MLKQGTRVIFILSNGGAVSGPFGTPALFHFQEFCGPCAEVIDEDGNMAYFSMFVVMQPATEAMIASIMEAREKGKADEARKKSGIVTARTVTAKDFKH